MPLAWWGSMGVRKKKNVTNRLKAWAVVQKVFPIICTEIEIE